MHFFFSGRMQVEDLPFEVRRVAALLKNNGVDSLYHVVLRAKPIIQHYDVTFSDGYDTVEVVEVLPFQDSLTTKWPLEDRLIAKRFTHRLGGPLALSGRHESAMWRRTGVARGAAAFERLSEAALVLSESSSPLLKL